VDCAQADRHILVGRLDVKTPRRTKGKAGNERFSPTKPRRPHRGDRPAGRRLLRRAIGAGSRSDISARWRGRRYAPARLWRDKMAAGTWAGRMQPTAFQKGPGRARAAFIGVARFSALRHGTGQASGPPGDRDLPLRPGSIRAQVATAGTGRAQGHYAMFGMKFGSNRGAGSSHIGRSNAWHLRRHVLRQGTAVRASWRFSTGKRIRMTPVGGGVAHAKNRGGPTETRLATYAMSCVAAAAALRVLPGRPTTSDDFNAADTTPKSRSLRRDALVDRPQRVTPMRGRKKKVGTFLTMGHQRRLAVMTQFARRSRDLRGNASVSRAGS